MLWNMYSLQGGYLLWCNNKYLFRVRVKLVDLVNKTLVYVLSSILSSVHTAMLDKDDYKAAEEG
jgi:hypothetical protein